MAKNPATYQGDSPIAHPIIILAERAFNLLIPLARHVRGMPFETPLRWQETHTDIKGPVYSRYIMIDFGDDRQITIEKEPANQYKGSWSITTRVPLPSHELYSEIKIIERQADRITTDVYYMFGHPGVSRGYRKGISSDESMINYLIQEVMNTAPARQAEFLQNFRSKGGN
jgi:hypothetical protein